MKNIMKLLKTITGLLILMTMTSMVQADNKEAIEACVNKTEADAIYLKEFEVDLTGSKNSQQPPMFRQALILRSNNIYRFRLCNEQGEAVIRLYDSSNMLLSSFDAKSGKDYNPVNFLCRKTGQYLVVINFKNNATGKATGIMSHVKK